MSIAKQKFELNDQEQITFCDVDGTVLEEDCLMDFLKSPNVTIVVQLQSDISNLSEGDASLNFSTASTISATSSDSTESESVSFSIHEIDEDGFLVPVPSFPSPLDEGSVSKITPQV